MVTYKSLKTKEKSSWVIPKVVAVAYGSGRLRELFITKLKSQFKRGFTKVVVTRTGRLRDVVARRASTVGSLRRILVAVTIVERWPLYRG